MQVSLEKTCHKRTLSAKLKSSKEKKRKRFPSSSSSSSSSSSVNSTSSSSSTSTDEKLKHKRKNRKARSSSDTSSTPSSSSGRKQKRKVKPIKHHESKRKSKKCKKKNSKINFKNDKTKKEQNEDVSADVPLHLMENPKTIAPMTKEQWEKQQSVVRKVFDETTGRHRLIKGNGEVIEEIVSRDQHKQINAQATRGDGDYFQRKLSNMPSK